MSIHVDETFTMPHVLSVARELVKLSLSGDEPDPLTNLRLQKLLYYAQAWSLVIRESELFSDELEAWGQGPVVPAAYHALSDGPIRVEAFAGAPVLRDEEAEFVRRLWEAYSPYSALQLSKMVREEAPGSRRGKIDRRTAAGTMPSRCSTSKLTLAARRCPPRWPPSPMSFGKGGRKRSGGWRNWPLSTSAA